VKPPATAAPVPSTPTVQVPVASVGMGGISVTLRNCTPVSEKLKNTDNKKKIKQRRLLSAYLLTLYHIPLQSLGDTVDF